MEYIRYVTLAQLLASLQDPIIFLVKYTVSTVTIIYKFEKFLLSPPQLTTSSTPHTWFYLLCGRACNYKNHVNDHITNLCNGSMYLLIHHSDATSCYACNAYNAWDISNSDARDTNNTSKALRSFPSSDPRQIHPTESIKHCVSQVHHDCIHQMLPPQPVPMLDYLTVLPTQPTQDLSPWVIIWQLTNWPKHSSSKGI